MQHVAHPRMDPAAPAAVSHVRGAAYHQGDRRCGHRNPVSFPSSVYARHHFDSLLHTAQASQHAFRARRQLFLKARLPCSRPPNYNPAADDPMEHSYHPGMSSPISVWPSARGPKSELMWPGSHHAQLSTRAFDFAKPIRRTVGGLRARRYKCYMCASFVRRIARNGATRGACAFPVVARQSWALAQVALHYNTSHA